MSNILRHWVLKEVLEYVYAIKDWIMNMSSVSGILCYKFIPGVEGRDLHAAIIRANLAFRHLAPHYVEYLHTIVFLIWKLYM